MKIMIRSTRAEVELATFAATIGAPQQLELVKRLAASLNCKLSHDGLLFKNSKLQRINFELFQYFWKPSSGKHTYM